jgi:hypothetical protein
MEYDIAGWKTDYLRLSVRQDLADRLISIEMCNETLLFLRAIFFYAAWRRQRFVATERIASEPLAMADD